MIEEENEKYSAALWVLPDTKKLFSELTDCVEKSREISKITQNDFLIDMCKRYVENESDPKLKQTLQNFLDGYLNKKAL